MQNSKNKQFARNYKYGTKIKNKFNAALLFIMCLLLFLSISNFFYVANNDKTSINFDAAAPAINAVVISLPDPSEYNLNKNREDFEAPSPWGKAYYNSEYKKYFITADYLNYRETGTHYGEDYTVDIPFEALNEFYGRLFKVTYNNINYDKNSNTITFLSSQLNVFGIFLDLVDAGALATSYTITYLNQDGSAFSDTSGLPTSYNKGEGATLLSPTRTGYEFVGWYDNADCTGSAITEISASDSGNKTFYAKWKIQTITITLNGTLYGENYMIYVYKGDAICKQVYVDKPQYTFELDWVSGYNKDYKLAFVFGCYGNLTFATGSSVNTNITTSNRVATISTFADTTLSFTLANPRINSTIII